MSRTYTMKGFTLFELMVTISVAAVIISFGVPSFMSMMANNQAAAHSNDMVTALNVARSEATRRGIPINLCSSTDGATCNGGNDWSTGWIVRVPGGAVIRSWPARSGGANIMNANVDTIQFQARGSLPGGAAPVMQVRLPHCSNDQGRDIRVNVAGRISVDRVDCP